MMIAVTGIPEDQALNHNEGRCDVPAFNHHLFIYFLKIIIPSTEGTKMKRTLTLPVFEKPSVMGKWGCKRTVEKNGDEFLWQGRQQRAMAAKGRKGRRNVNSKCPKL